MATQQNSGAVRVLIVFLLLWRLSDSGLASESGQARRWFKHPPSQYSTGPLWVWNDLLTEQQIREGLRDLAAQQVKQVWVHPRPGLMTPYLGSDWFRLWRVTLQEAKRLGMKVWIYDENSYPSGFAGGLVPESMPEARGRGLSMVITNQPPAWSTNMLAVYRLTTNGAEEVSARLKTGERPAGSNYLAVSEVRSSNAAWTANRSYVNLLSPGVREKFLQLTLEPYRRELGKEFGRQIPGVFTDEPNIQPTEAGWPWSEVLLDQFQTRWGYSLRDRLASLSQPVGDWRQVRYDYFRLLNDEFIEHWSKPYHDYCARMGLQWTGHYWDHDWPKCLHVPDNMAMYAWHQTPAIDCLMNQYEARVDSQFGNVRMVRELASVANQLGLKRTLCETYGAGGWDLRLEDMKRIGDWLEVLGVNLINQHLSYVTIRGARKRDHPQSFSYHEPWWKAYHVSAEYLARLSVAMSQGEQINSILLLEPTTTAWMYQGENARLKELGNSFLELVTTLESSQVEYDLGSEDILRRQAAVGLAGLRMGRRVYGTVILAPGTENLNVETVDRLEEFLASGGTVLSCGPAPGRVNGMVSGRVSALATSTRWRQVQPAVLTRVLSNSPGFVIRREPDDQGTLFHHRRQLADGQMLLLVNTSLESRSAGMIESDLGGVSKWDPYTGKTEVYPFEKNARGITAGYRLEPSGSLLLFLSKKSQKPSAASQEIVSVIQPAAGPDIRRLSENVLTLDFVDVTVGTETKTNLYCYEANKFIWKKHGREGDPWDSAVQFGSELISATFPAGSGFEASYRFRIEGAVPTNLAIVVERPDLYAITCNGLSVRASPGEWWLDKAFGRIPIARLARAGENVVTIKADSLTMFHELEAAYLLGNFALDPSEHGFSVRPDRPLRLRAGSGKFREGWNKQGQPFYGGGVSYRERFVVDRLAGRFAVSLPEWYGSVAQVCVNGKRAGYIDAPPWQLDVTPWMKRRENEVEVTVIGTLKNTLGPHHGAPALGAAWPKRFQTGPESGPPAGTNYSTVAYGLFKPFVLRQTVNPAQGL